MLAYRPLALFIILCLLNGCFSSGDAGRGGDRWSIREFFDRDDFQGAGLRLQERLEAKTLAELNALLADPDLTVALHAAWETGEAPRRKQYFNQRSQGIDAVHGVTAAPQETELVLKILRSRAGNPPPIWWCEGFQDLVSKKAPTIQPPTDSSEVRVAFPTVGTTVDERAVEVRIETNGGAILMDKALSKNK